MSKLVKELICQELTSRFADVTNAVWIEMAGVDGVTTTEFRRGLHGKKMRVEVVSNALLRLATKDRPLNRLAEHLAGPSALITGGESAIEVAKIVEEWMPKIKTLKLRGALLEGEYINEQAVSGLSKMPSKRDLQARIAGIALAPGGKLAAAINSGGGRIAGCIKALIEKLEKGETAGETAGEAAPAA